MRSKNNILYQNKKVKKKVRKKARKKRKTLVRSMVPWSFRWSPMVRFLSSYTCCRSDSLFSFCSFVNVTWCWSRERLSCLSAISLPFWFFAFSILFFITCYYMNAQKRKKKKFNVKIKILVVNMKECYLFFSIPLIFLLIWNEEFEKGWLAVWNVQESIRELISVWIVYFFQISSLIFGIRSVPLLFFRSRRLSDSAPARSLAFDTAEGIHRVNRHRFTDSKKIK